ncbi:Putative malate transporter YflS [Salmonella enterica subsp. enterica serovar Typhisuis]|uniref:DASS family sodium-coupled anion symporter n=1 Tax=Salmonella enterica TaxID=28901 RepID=A0A749KUU2_SALER|nr:DASS family sodium-coupled anion symporter [Salmonella enterica subsp. enterica serovar Typhisuis]HAF2720207.1 DASS family sodium-coupled anion symporter [Salmonella enterica]EAV9430703.1 DASS family sodium-coupled anion symporter [Salmonella enterica subsp. enterica serovar Typhisuis]EBY9900021.1 DASS family sodium-coupled anion symporter [Salmonella enterica subsp. enterica serovar Typhisuis]ECG2226337.1 DASS family sodium-coupled anion symporter [Salmonella enterica subsp. enterica serova
MAEKKSQGVKWLPFILILVIAAGLWQLTPPSGLSAPAWHSAIIFVATIASIVAKVLPIGAVGIIGITVFALAYAAGDKTASGAITTALSELNSSLIWLIVVAFMIARGFIKTGLGRRIALQMIRLLGKRTLGLAYGLAFADLILSPAMPSNTARCGVIYPIADSLARSFDSHPEDESRSKIGTFLITCIGNVNDVIAALLPCLVSFLIVPLLVYWLTRPEIKHTPDAPDLARKELAQMGSMTRGEWLMLATVGVLLVLWIFGSSLGVDATTASFVGLSILLLSGVLTWEDVKSEKGAWDTLIWFAALLMMANQLKKLGFTSWFGNLIGDSIGSTMHGTSWIIILLLLNAAYFYTHYFFASGNAQIAALYAVFLGVGLHLNIPAAPMALMLAFTSSLYCSLTQYTHARGPILFGAGYVPTGVWWRTGFIISLFNQAVFLTVGLAWWKVLGLY